MSRDAKGRFLPGHPKPDGTGFPNPRLLSPEARARMVAGNDSAKGRKGAKASPWSRGPHCKTNTAGLAFLRARAKAKRED